jgi:hypothetical protein
MSKEEYRPQPSKQPEQHMPQQERGNGSPGIPPSVHERANSPPERQAYPTFPQKSTLNRAVERTRDLYERNGWLLPFSAAGKDSSTLPSRPPTTVYSAPSHTHLLEEPTNPAKIQTPQEAGKASPKAPQPQSESESNAQREWLDRDMRELMEKIGDRKLFFEMLADAMAEKVKGMSKQDRERTFERLKALNRIRMQDMDPKNAKYLRQMVGEPLDPSLSDEKLQRMFDLPPADNPPSDEKR